MIEFIWLLVIVVVALVAVFLLMPAPPQQDAKKKHTLGDFNFPTSNNGRSIPILYGTRWMFGNTLENCCLSTEEIHA